MSHRKVRYCIGQTYYAIVGSGVWICSSMLCFTLWARRYIHIKLSYLMCNNLKKHLICLYDQLFGPWYWTSCYSSILSAFIKFKPSSKKTNSNRHISILIFRSYKTADSTYLNVKNHHLFQQTAHLIYVTFAISHLLSFYNSSKS